MAGDLKCDVCGGEAVGTAVSPLGAVSFAYCFQCLEHDAEPAAMFETVYRTTGGAGVAGWLHELSTFVDGHYVTWDQWLKGRRSANGAKGAPANG